MDQALRKWNKRAEKERRMWCGQAGFLSHCHSPIFNSVPSQNKVAQRSYVEVEVSEMASISHRPSVDCRGWGGVRLFMAD